AFSKGTKLPLAQPHQMTTRKKILASLLLLAVLSVMAWQIFRPRDPDPIYDGHPLSYWFEEGHGAIAGNGAVWMQSELAVRHVGSNAIPRLSGDSKRLVLMAKALSPN